VRIGRIAGPARLRGAHGTLVLGTTEGQVDVATSGSLTIERALGDVTARTAYGAIRVLEAEGGVLRLESAYKEVEVGVPAGVAAWVDAASAHGVIRNELTPDPEAAGTDRTIELHLRANWADVFIRRAAPRSA
jgi:DNA-binding transcriptional regulator YdaS (Cro superfamily)